MNAVRRAVSCWVVIPGSLFLLGTGTAGTAQPQEIWPQDWFTDLPAVDLSGSWLFDAAHSDPMLGEWAGGEVRYLIDQQPAFIILEFRGGAGEPNAQTYSWDGSIREFQRGGRHVQEAARWTRAGRQLEVAGRHWNPQDPEARVDYRFTYDMRGDVLTFVQESETGRIVWRFVKERGERAPR